MSHVNGSNVTYHSIKKGQKQTLIIYIDDPCAWIQFEVFFIVIYCDSSYEYVAPLFGSKLHVSDHKKGQKQTLIIHIDDPCAWIQFEVFVIVVYCDHGYEYVAPMFGSKL